MPTLTLVAGLPGSGKSTLAREIAGKNPGKSVIVERDMIRYDIMGLTQGEYDFDHKTEQEVTDKQQELVRMYLKNGLDVIVSDTNLRDKYLRNFMRVAEEVEASVIFEDLRNLPLEEALRRNKMRSAEKVVPDEVIRSMHERFIKSKKQTDFGKLPSMEKWSPKSKFRFDLVENYVPPALGMSTYLFDIDGTLASHIGIRSPYDSTLYHMDKVHEEVKDVAVALHNNGHKIIIVTGRHMKHRVVVDKWLRDNGIPFDDLIMREDPERSDDEEKLYLFEKFLRNDESLRIRGVYDDRNRVAFNTWRTALGIRCFHVAWGDF